MTLKKKKMTSAEVKKKTKSALQLILIIAIGMSYLFFGGQIKKWTTDYKQIISKKTTTVLTEYDDGKIDGISEYRNTPYEVLNDNEPEFTDSEKNNTKEYYKYSELDDYGRCGTAMACIGEANLQTEERGDISNIKPSGWQSIEADDVDGGWLYNRSHLIANCLGGPCGRDGENEDDLKKNLITGTRYMNVEGMEKFELMIRDYISETKNHVIYRVTPLYKNNDLLAGGVKMEAYSVEDDGDGITFNVFCYNVQPGYKINYATGEIVKD